MSHPEATRAESLDDQELRGEADDKKPKNRRPANYSECAEKAPTSYAASISDQVKSSFKSSGEQSTPTWQRFNESGTTICRLIFEIPDTLEPPVLLYYRLTNFYQNHRRYVKSMDTDQLKGKAVDNSTIDGGSCDPLKLDPSTGKAYYPCGLIANSQFNDTIRSPQLLSGGVTAETYNMTNKGIAWDSDKQLIKKTQYNKWQVVPPPNWHDRYPNGYADGIPNLHEDEEFMVWMRTAALPAFSGLCIVLGALFTIAHLVRPRKLGDHTYLTWNNEQESSAVATGRDGRFGSHAT
ncbi:hypothetical protein AbraIFM66950_000488 [Aspergillus brasiliensis]|nr:hypothetical protein AbraIFM66950_000488 [Aspergillus brasiliensis]